MTGQEFIETVAAGSPLAKVHPRLAEALRDYLAGEKAVAFGEQLVINTQFPPYPSRAFDNLAEQFQGPADARRLYSVTLAVTNRCTFRCWHCYNAGRSQKDVPRGALKRLAGELQDLGAVMVTLTGGEPLLRDDLEEICGAFDQRSCVIVGTTGWGLTNQRAVDLKASGVFAVGISLDSDEPEEHDRLRGRQGAFRAALDAMAAARQARMYPYVVTVGRRELLEPDRFFRFMDFAGRSGAMEVHLLEPSATGRLAGRTDALLSNEDSGRILEYQRQIASRQDLPVLSTFAYAESPQAFGCGAGLTHIYIDGSGELCPCNLVPLSFGNVTREPLRVILDRMGRHFRRPRVSCVGKLLAEHIPSGPLPAGPEVCERICREHLPAEHPVPRFYEIRMKPQGQAGVPELQEAYNRVHEDYDDFWVVEAGKPVEQLVEKLDLRGDERIFEAGCGSGYGSALLARRLRRGGHLVAVDISEGMLSQARRRLAAGGFGQVDLRHGDALAALAEPRGLDLVFTTWVLGYIPLRPFLAAAAGALANSGRLAFIVHKDRSPREPMEIFAKLAAQDPAALRQQVVFDFPRDLDHIRAELPRAGLAPVDLWDGEVVFRYPSAEAVLEHLLKSGAGTVFYDAVDPSKRPILERQFLEMLRQRHGASGQYPVVHDYIACIARKQ